MSRAVVCCIVGTIIALFDATPCRADTVADALVGRWYGIHVAQHGDLHSEDFFDFEFIRDPQGLLFRDNGRFVMVGEPVRVTVSPDGTVRADWQQMMQVALDRRAHRRQRCGTRCAYRHGWFHGRRRRSAGSAYAKLAAERAVSRAACRRGSEGDSL